MSAAKAPIIQVCCVISLLFAVSIGVRATDVDPTFNAVPSNSLSASNALQQVVQPDGKVIVFGVKSVVEGIAKGDIFRLNADGTLDNTFNYCGCGLGTINNLELMSDGRIIVGGAIPGFAKMIRLNPDGSIDPTFAPTSPGPTPAFFGSADFTVEAVQPDGKVLAMRRYTSMGFVAFYLARYNADGSVDSGFAEIGLTSGSPAFATVEILLLADGKFYLALTAGNNGSVVQLRRRNPDGTIDPTWEAPSFGPTTFGALVNVAGLALEPDGSLLVAGRWDTVNGLNKKNLVRLLPAGNVDVNFTPPTVFWGTGVHRLADGKILFSGNTDISTIYKIFRLNADGTTDNTFVMDPTVTSALNRWVVDSSGRIIFVGQMTGGPRLVRLLSNGTRDIGFNPNVTVYGRITAVATQTDGKVLMAGIFSQMNGVARATIARVNADGTLDPTFDPGTGFSTPPATLLIQPDGKILAHGQFSTFNGTSRQWLARINPDGSLDNSFSVTTSAIPEAIASQGDGKILIVGWFTSVNGTPRTGVARLNVDGSLDNSFNPTIGSPQLGAVLAQADGSIMIGGSFTGVNGFNRSNLARLFGDGSLDQTFTAAGLTRVNGIWRQPDGKYVLTVGFNGNAITRRNADGTADTGFTPPNISWSNSSTETLIQSVLLQPDGTILIGGRFDRIGSATRPYITRLAPNGTHDPLFLPAGADNRVHDLAAYSTGKIIVGGDFTFIDNVSKPGNARLNISQFRVKTPYDFNGDGRADYTVYRPSSGVWYELFSNGDPYAAPVFGLSGDIPVPADFDGDGKTDLAIWRPSNGDWWYKGSGNGVLATGHFGTTGDIPRPSDFDGDGKADFIVFRPSTNLWYRSGTTAGQPPPFNFGLAGDQPVIGDFDGDGKSDMAVFRPSSGDWWYAASSASNAFRFIHWGQNGDIPAPADFDGDGKTDCAVFRPSNGGWYVLKSSDQSFTILSFGLDGDRPVPADYDGDGRADIAVFRPSTGVWYLLQSTAGSGGVQWGVSTDVAIPNAFQP